MSATFKRLGQSELLPRYIFAESLYARRRVLEIGAVASTLGQSARFLATRGARVVVAADSDVAAVQEAQARWAGPNLRFRAQVFDDFESGSFDLVMVADLAPYVRAPDLLRELARLVAKGGFLMGGLRNPAGLALSNVMEAEDQEAPPTYGQLLDALTNHFTSIEVATQSPVLGYQIAFERGEGLQVDGSLAGQSEAAYYVVMAGNEPVRNFDPTWVQLPPEPLAFTGGKLDESAHRARDWKDRSDRLREALTKKTTELTGREVELHELKQQHEASTDAVFRLTAQLEAVRESRQALEQRDELANRIQRMEAEITVARERAIDAEGRMTAARTALEALQRAQKDGAVQALAAVEQARLERARREEVGAQLDDARARLAKAYEELRRVQDDAGAGRVDAERAKMAIDRLKQELASKDGELNAAKERELKIAELRTQALQAIENLEHSLAEARKQAAEARDEATRKEAERYATERQVTVALERHGALEAELQRDHARAETLAHEVERRGQDLAALDTELQASRAAQARAQRDIETLAGSERNFRETAGQLERQLADTTANVQQLSDQLAQVEAARDSETARGRRLELDLSTAVTAERNAREQAQASLADAQAKLKEATDDRDALIGQRDDLKNALGDLVKARASELGRAEALEQRAQALATRETALENDLAALRSEKQDLAASASAQEKALRALLDERDRALATASELVATQQVRLAEQERALAAEREVTASLEAQGREEGGRLEEALRALEAERRDGKDRLLAERKQAAERLDAFRKAADERLVALRHQRDVQVDGLNQTIEQQRRELDAVRAELGLVTQTGKDAQAEIEAARQLNFSLRDQLDEAYRTLDAEQAQAKQLRASAGEEQQALADRLAQADRQLEELRGRVTRLDHELEQERAEVQQRGQQLLELDRKARAHEEQAQLAGSQLGEAVASREAVSARLATVEVALAEAAEARRQQLDRLTAAEGEVVDATRALELGHAGWNAEREELAAANRREIEALREATTRALDARHAENEHVLQLLRDEHQQALEQQAAAYRGSLEARQAEAQKALAAKEADAAAQLAALQARLVELERQRDTVRQDADQARERAEADRAANAAELEGVRRQLADVRGVVERAQSEARGHQAGKMALQQELDTARAELNALRSSLAQAGGETRAMSEARTHLEGELERMRQKVTPLEAELEQLRARQGELSALRAQVPELQTGLEVARARAAEQERTAEEHRGRVGALETELTARAQRVAALEQQLEGSKRAPEIERASQAARETLEAVQAELAREQEKRLAQEAELTELRRRTSLLDKQLAEAQRQAPQTDDEVGRLRTRLPELEAELEIARINARNEVEAAGSARRQAEELLLALRVKYGELQHELNVTLESVQGLRDEVPLLREQVTELGAENALLETERGRLAETMDRLEKGQATAEKEARIRSLEREVATLKAELEGLARGGRPPVRSSVSRAIPMPSASAPPPPKRAPAAPPKPAGPDVVLELEVGEGDTEGEEIVLLDEEATDPGATDPRKK